MPTHIDSSFRSISLAQIIVILVANITSACGFRLKPHADVMFAYCEVCFFLQQTQTRTLPQQLTAYTTLTPSGHKFVFY